MVMRAKTYKRKVDEQLKLREPKCPACDKKLSRLRRGGSKPHENVFGISKGIAGFVPQHPAPKCAAYKAYYQASPKKGGAVP